MKNKVILIGNLGKDPETRSLENGAKVSTFSIATSETYKDKAGEKVTNTTWHNLVLWRGLADVAEKYLKKGALIYVEGKIANRSYEAKDGTKRYITEIVVGELVMLGKKGDNDRGVPAGGEEVAAKVKSDIAKDVDHGEDGGADDDDLPF